MLSEVLSCPIRWLPVEKAPMDPSYWTESYRLAKTTFFLFLFCRGGGGGSPKNCSHVYWARVFWPIWKFYLGRTLAQFHRSPDAKELHPPARTQGGGLKNGRSEGPNAHIFESSRVGPLGRSRACTSRAPNGKKKKKEREKEKTNFANRPAARTWQECTGTKNILPGVEFSGQLWEILKIVQLYKNNYNLIA